MSAYKNAPSSTFNCGSLDGRDRGVGRSESVVHRYTVCADDGQVNVETSQLIYGLLPHNAQRISPHATTEHEHVDVGLGSEDGGDGHRGCDHRKVAVLGHRMRNELGLKPLID